jgi:hypothetical protein
VSRAKAGDKAKFCRSFKWKIEIKWFDRVGVHQLPDGRLARIEIVTRGTVGDYRAFKVSILSKQEGVIDQHVFAFDDYFAETTDNRIERFEVVEHCGWKWYIEKPRTTRPLTAAIEEYIATFHLGGA